MWHVIASIIGSVAMRIEEALSPSLKNESFSASMNKFLQKTHHRQFQKPYSPASHATHEPEFHLALATHQLLVMIN